MSNCHFGANAVFNGPVNFSADGDVAGRDFHHQPTTNYYAAPGGGYRGLPQLLQQVEVNGSPAPHQVLYDANGAGNLCLYDCMRWMFDPLKSPDRIKAELLDLLSDTVQGKYGDVMQQRQIRSLCALHNEGDVGFRPPRPETPPRNPPPSQRRQHRVRNRRLGLRAKLRLVGGGHIGRHRQPGCRRSGSEPEVPRTPPPFGSCCRRFAGPVDLIGRTAV